MAKRSAAMPNDSAKPRPVASMPSRTRAQVHQRHAGAFGLGMPP